MDKKNRLLALVLAGVVLAAGATYLFWPDGTNEPELAETGIETAETAAVYDEPTETMIASEVDTEIPVDSEASATPPLAEITSTATVQPTARTEMEGTDPNSVSLASGNYQLVELFAFW